MKPKKFESKIQQVAEEWCLDAQDLIRGTFKQAGKPKGPRRRLNKLGENLEPNLSIHRIHILKLRSYFEVCPKCGLVNENPRFTINIRDGKAKNSECGCVLPHFKPVKYRRR